MINKQEMTWENIASEYELLINSLDCLEDCYCSVVDATGKIVYSSKGFEKVDGYKVSDVLGKNVMDFYKTTPQNSAHMKAIFEKRVLRNYIMKYNAADGRAIEFVMDIYPIFSGSKIIGSFAISHDTREIEALTATILQLQKALCGRSTKYANGTYFCFDDIIGDGQSMQSTISLAKRVARSESRVMILGETGTGKELFAQSIHNDSLRAKEPFIAINCSAIPDNLLESILFGTTKGAFTGAENKPGLFEQVKNGTLFLDEINSMSPLLQSKLLRALESNRIRRLGSNNEIPVNPRILSAMNDDPEVAIENGKLRSDFYYRLAVVTINCPPLRDRKEDIITLARYYITKYNKLLGRKISGISEEVIQILEDYNWPGNVRELSHCIEHAMNMLGTEDTSLLMRHLPSFLQSKALKHNFFPITVPKINDYKQIMLQVEKEILTQTLKKVNGNINRAAKELGISRQCLFYKLKRLKIDIQREINIKE